LSAGLPEAWATVRGETLLELGTSNRFLDWANGTRLRRNRLAGIRLVRIAIRFSDLNIAPPFYGYKIVDMEVFLNRQTFKP